MKKIVKILILLIGFVIQAQNPMPEFRTLIGKIVDFKGEPMPGQTIIIKSTELGTTTDWDGNFCLVVPENQIIFIEISCCFTPIFRAIEPDDKYVKIKIGRKSQERKNKKAYNKWKPIKESLPIIMKRIYSEVDYDKIAENICR